MTIEVTSMRRCSGKVNNLGYIYTIREKFVIYNSREFENPIKKLVLAHLFLRPSDYKWAKTKGT